MLYEEDSEKDSGGEQGVLKNGLSCWISLLWNTYAFFRIVAQCSSHLEMISSRSLTWSHRLDLRIVDPGSGLYEDPTGGTFERLHFL